MVKIRSNTHIHIHQYMWCVKSVYIPSNFVTTRVRYRKNIFLNHVSQLSLLLFFKFKHWLKLHYLEMIYSVKICSFCSRPCWVLFWSINFFIGFNFIGKHKILRVVPFSATTTGCALHCTPAPNKLRPRNRNNFFSPK